MSARPLADEPHLPEATGFEASEDHLLFLLLSVLNGFRRARNLATRKGKELDLVVRGCQRRILLVIFFEKWDLIPTSTPSCDNP